MIPYNLRGLWYARKVVLHAIQVTVRASSYDGLLARIDAVLHSMKVTDFL